MVKPVLRLDSVEAQLELTGKQERGISEKTLEDESSLHYRHPHPLDNVSLFNWITVRWLNPILALGRKQPLTVKDVWPLPTSLQSAVVGQRFDAAFSDCQADGRKNPVHRALWQTFGKAYMVVTLHWAMIVVTQLLAPYFVKGIVQYLGNSEKLVFGLTNGYTVAVCLLVCTLGSLLAMSQAFLRMYLICVGIRSCIMRSVFNKACQLTASARNSASVGEMTNLISNDTERVYFGVMMSQQLWTGNNR